ncbi:protein SET DOMAIN GROUP 40 [Durio zibethinus]|uniref:Protein SET DOMAIN GROUP 40 n=1 Tax=Durio zibethinus TaxID=66656 RepID=A0A6P6B4E1_DURZI|nr:protein SET DOMAIN GROUP 40 [Durio zibethinus]
MNHSDARARGQEEEEVKRFLKLAAGLGVSDSENPESSCSSLGHSLAVSYFPDSGGRGLAALRPISKGELLLRVPKSALITTHSLSKDETLSLALKAHPSLSPAQLFTVCLLYEMSKGKASPWHPYLLLLPRSYTTLAAFGEFETQALQVDYAVWAAHKAVSKAEYEWKQASTLMKELKLKHPLLTFRGWIWATGTISSRTLHIPWDEAGCLCPVGDLFNYAAPGEDVNGYENVDNLQNDYAKDDLDTNHFQRLTDAAYEADAAAYCFYAKQNYKMGEQVLLSYGTYTNLELLEHYGFLLEDNPNEKVFIPLELDIHCFSSWPKDSLYIHQNGRPSFALTSALRLWATPPYQRKSIGHLAYSGSQLSQGNEISVMKWIAKKCHAILKDMPTSIEEDKSLLSFIEKMEDFDNLWEWGKAASAFGGEFCKFLKASGLKSDDELIPSGRTKMLIDRWKLAVQWRRIYKKVLVDCISHCTDIINSLSG